MFGNYLEVNGRGYWFACVQTAIIKHGARIKSLAVCDAERLLSAESTTHVQLVRLHEEAAACVCTERYAWLRQCRQ